MHSVRISNALYCFSVTNTAYWGINRAMPQNPINPLNKMNPCGGKVNMMNSSIFNKLFKIKYGPRADDYDAENQIPGWDEKFNILFDDLLNRKELMKRVIRNYDVLQIDRVRKSLPHDILDAVIENFEEICKLRFSNSIECIIAQESMMLVYGIKICINVIPLIKTEQDAKKFYRLYSILQDITEGLNSTFSRKEYPFWHAYCFKIALQWIVLGLKVKETSQEFLNLEEGYSIRCMGHHYGFNPLYFILPAITGSRVDNIFMNECLRKEVVSIIESGIKK